jgi:hypothetical protein
MTRECVVHLGRPPPDEPPWGGDRQDCDRLTLPMQEVRAILTTIYETPLPIR